MSNCSEISTVDDELSTCSNSSRAFGYLLHLSITNLHRTVNKLSLNSIGIILNCWNHRGETREREERLNHLQEIADYMTILKNLYPEEAFRSELEHLAQLSVQTQHRTGERSSTRDIGFMFGCWDLQGDAYCKQDDQHDSSDIDRETIMVDPSNPH